MFAWATVLGKRKKSDITLLQECVFSGLDGMKLIRDLQEKNNINNEVIIETEKKLIIFNKIIEDSCKYEQVRYTHERIRSILLHLKAKRRKGKILLTDEMINFTTKILESRYTLHLPELNISDFEELEESLEYHKETKEHFILCLKTYNEFRVGIELFLAKGTIIAFTAKALLKNKINLNKTQIV